MKFDISFERVYPHPLEKVWDAVTNPAALGQWLMETDFVPEEGRSFRMWCENSEKGTDHHLCTVLELDAPNRMRWSWTLDGRQSEGETYVEFRLERVAIGTRVTIQHSGDRDRATIDAFKSGWPYKMGRLGDVLRGGAA